MGDRVWTLTPERLDFLRRGYRVPGTAVGIIDAEGVVSVDTAGIADPAGRLVSADSRFQVASLTKVITAWAALRMVADGLIDLDEPVLPHLDWDLPLNGHGHGEGITLRALLSHTAGLPRAASPQFSDEASIPSLVGLLGGTDGVPVGLEADPGSVFRYSNPGYVLIELLIKSRTGIDFAEWTRTTVLEPMGMKASSFHRTASAVPEAVTPHRYLGHPLPQIVYGYLASGGLWTTVPDLLKLVAAMGPVNRGAGVLPPALVEEMWSSPPAAHLFLRHGGYGLGQIWGILASGQRFVANQGSRPGWRSLLLVLPDRGSGMVALTNANSGLPMTVHLALRWLRATQGEPLRPWRVLTVPRRSR
jgi:CubicO group peptidase (beta-lactamase class C family)